MGLNFQRPLYENGNIFSNNKSSFLELGELSIGGSGSTVNSSLMNMYDTDDTSYTYIKGSGTQAFNLTWEFDERRYFKTIYITVGIKNSEAGASTVTLTIDCSNDNSTWTELKTVSAASTTEVKRYWLITGASYKYIRIQADSTAQDFDVNIYGIKGVI